MTRASVLVEAKSLCKQFIVPPKKILNALDNLSLNFKSGQITALVGADGAGKTTLLRMICGLLTPSSGKLTVLGFDSVNEAQKIQNRISYMPQRFGLYEDLSVQENFDLYANLHGVPTQEKNERFERLMQIMDLYRFTTRPAGKLSGGMKQKLGLACTLVRSPELLLLDEPSVGVDPYSRQELWRIIKQLVGDEKLSVLLSTTYLDEAARCEEVFILHEGKLLAQGTPKSISNKADGLCFSVAPTANQHVRLLQTMLFDHPIIIDSVPRGGQAHVVFRQKPNKATLQETLGNNICQATKAELEDGFMVLLSEQKESSPHKQIKPLNAKISAKKIQTENIITVKNLLRRFGDFIAVDHTSFDVKKGEIFGLLGPNGAGKTTTFRMLCGLLPASDGFLEVGGINLRTARASARKKIGYVSQKFSLYGNLTTEENLHFFGRAYGLYGKTLKQRIAEIIDEFDLGTFYKTPTIQIPGGFKQRLSMATALLHKPDVLFLDEATSGADTIARRNFWRQISSLTEQGTTTIITTHFMEEAEYCDRVLIQDAGKMLALGTPQQIREQAAPDEADKISMDQAFIRIVLQSREHLHSRYNQ